MRYYYYDIRINRLGTLTYYVFLVIVCGNKHPTLIHFMYLPHNNYESPPILANVIVNNSYIIILDSTVASIFTASSQVLYNELSDSHTKFHHHSNHAINM